MTVEEGRKLMVALQRAGFGSWAQEDEHGEYFVFMGGDGDIDKAVKMSYEGDDSRGIVCLMSVPRED